MSDETQGFNTNEVDSSFARAEGDGGLFRDARATMPTEAEAIADLALGAAEPDLIDAEELYTVVTPAGAKRHVLDLEKYLASPKRVRGLYKVTSLQSFVDYTKGFYDPLHTTVWVDPDAFKITAVLNDHQMSQPAWGDHQVVLQLVHTKEWLHWIGKDGEMLNQAQFAEHIEDGLIEIVSPPAADMLEMAQTMKGATKVEWTSSQRITNGEIQFAYTEEATAQAGRARTLEIPEKFFLSIAPFYGEDPSSIHARLRYRAPNGSNLQIGYKLERPDDVLQASIEAMALRLKTEHEFANVYTGAPRA
jgi:uncharacterized protein YfdQ (DUF2303 family)